jgi:hypothetical protein
MTLIERCLLLAGVLSACVSGAKHVVAAAQTPNIILVLIDDLPWDDLGCTGNPIVVTPNIDRIGREGAKFRR